MVLIYHRMSWEVTLRDTVLDRKKYNKEKKRFRLSLTRTEYATNKQKHWQIQSQNCYTPPEPLLEEDDAVKGSPKRP